MLKRWLVINKMQIIRSNSVQPEFGQVPSKSNLPVHQLNINDLCYQILPFHKFIIHQSPPERNIEGSRSHNMSHRSMWISSNIINWWIFNFEWQVTYSNIIPESSLAPIFNNKGAIRQHLIFNLHQPPPKMGVVRFGFHLSERFRS